jgi:hypothetical protein
LPSNTQDVNSQPNGEKPGSSVPESVIPDKVADASNFALGPALGHTTSSATTPSLVAPVWKYSLSFLSDVYLCESFDLNT